MNKNEEKCLIECLMAIDKSLLELNTSLIYLSNNLYAIKNFFANPEELTKSTIIKSLFPHLLTDETLKYDHDKPITIDPKPESTPNNQKKEG